MSAQPETVTKQIRPFYWSVRRELWENRSLYMAPLIVAGVVVFGFIFSAIGLAERRHEVLLLDDPMKQRAAIEMPYDMAALMLMFTAFIVGLFYCLDALYGERRDRSVLFWKSMPVSDRTSVLAKAFVPLVVMPFITFALILAAQLMILLITSILLLFHGMNPVTTITHTNLVQNSMILFYALIALSLWHAPTYAWALLVSSWARRATFLWAVLPVIAISIFERITSGTSYFSLFIRDRFMSWAAEAFALRHGPKGMPILDTLSQLTPGRYLMTPGLWLGLIVAAVFLVLAIRLRRYQGPV
ncbi:MAG: ABC transporter permease [Chthoniobacterales bacterium]